MMCESETLFKRKHIYRSISNDVCTIFVVVEQKAILNSFSGGGGVYRRQILTSKDGPRAERVNEVMNKCFRQTRDGETVLA